MKNLARFSGVLVLATLAVSSCASLKSSKNASNYDDAYMTSADLSTDPFYSKTKVIAPTDYNNNQATASTPRGRTYGRTYSDRFNNFGNRRLYVTSMPMAAYGMSYNPGGMFYSSYMPYNSFGYNPYSYYNPYGYGCNSFGMGYGNSYFGYSNYYNPYYYNPYYYNPYSYYNPFFSQNNWNKGWSSNNSGSSSYTNTNNNGRRVTPNTGMGSSQTRVRTNSYNSGYSSGGSGQSSGETHRQNNSGSYGGNYGSGGGGVVRQSASSSTSGASSTTTHSGSSGNRRR